MSWVYHVSQLNVKNTKLSHFFYDFFIVSEEAGVNGTSFSTKMEKGNFFRIRCHSKERVSYDIPIIFLETSYLV